MTTAQANDVRRVLVRALELLEQGRCQRVFARDKDGLCVRACAASACRWPRPGYASVP